MKCSARDIQDIPIWKSFFDAHSNVFFIFNFPGHAFYNHVADLTKQFPISEPESRSIDVSGQNKTSWMTKFEALKL